MVKNIYFFRGSLYLYYAGCVPPGEMEWMREKRKCTRPGAVRILQKEHPKNAWQDECLMSPRKTNKSPFSSKDNGTVIFLFSCEGDVSKRETRLWTKYCYDIYLFLFFQWKSIV